MGKEKQSKGRLSLKKKSSPTKSTVGQNILTLFQRQTARSQGASSDAESSVNSSAAGIENYPAEKKSKYFPIERSSASTTDKIPLSPSKSSKLSLKRKSSLQNQDKSTSEEISTRKLRKSEVCTQVQSNDNTALTSSLFESEDKHSDVILNNSQRKSPQLDCTNLSEKCGKTDTNVQDPDTNVQEYKYSMVNKNENHFSNAESCSSSNNKKLPETESVSGLTVDLNCDIKNNEKESKKLNSQIDCQVNTKISNSEIVDNTDVNREFSKSKSGDKETVHSNSQQFSSKTHAVFLESQTSDLSLPENQDGQDEKFTIDPITGEIEYKVPYYLENFMFILNYIMEEDFYAYLFSDADLEVVTSFKNLTENSQKVYVRLFGRQYRWIRKSKIVYPKIQEDLTEQIEELCESGLLMNESSLDDLPEVLKALPVPDLKTVGKSLRLNTSQLREDLIEAIMKHTAKSNIGSFFKVQDSASNKSKSGIYNTVLQRAKKLLGNCYKLDRESRSVFMRVTMLFGLHNMHGEEDERGGGQTQLFQMLMSNIGRVKFPEYTVLRETKIFQDRNALQRFSSALQMEVEIAEHLEKKDYDSAREIYNSAQVKYSELKDDGDIMSHDKSLPPFLRRYTACSVLTRVLSYGVELLQFTKDYVKAVEQLNMLIGQDLYHLDYRGRWYERLTLNLDHHLKKPSEALDLIKAGLEDENIRKGHRLALYQRAQKICNAVANKKLRQRWIEFSEDVMACVHDPPKVFIKGRQLQGVAPGGFSMFISDSSLKESDEVTFLKRVEDVALNHYKEQGYTEGLHAEGGIFAFLLTLYMWDVIFCETVPNVFYNMYQAMPLDLYTLDFYDNRKTMIDNRLEEIKNASSEDLAAWLEQSWEAHKDTVCVGGNWELFRDVQHVQGLVSCMGGSILAAIFDRMVKDLRFTRSGVPDLTVWNPETKAFKISEVKGPGDRLSTKQILWLDYFLCLGLDAEVCHVQAVGAKKLH